MGNYDKFHFSRLIRILTESPGSIIMIKEICFLLVCYVAVALAKDNYCCQVATPVKHQDVVKHKTVMYWKSVFQNGIPMEVPYYKLETVTEQVEIKLPCPDDQLKCCAGFREFNDNCYSDEEYEIISQLGPLIG